MDKLFTYRVFARVVDLNSFGRASLDLNVSLSTVSKCVSHLEERLGVLLLNRNTRSLSVTEEGRDFYRHAMHVLALIDEEEDRFAGGGRGPSGRLRIDVPPSFSVRYLAPVLPGFRERHPGIELEVHVSTREVNLVQSGMDCAIRWGNLPDSSLIFRPLGVTRLITLAAPAYLHRRGCPQDIDDLQQHDCILWLPSGGEPRRWEFERDRQHLEVEVTGRMVLGTSDMCVAACAAGLGLTQTVSFAAREHVANGTLRVVLRHLSTQGPPIGIVYPGSRVLSRKVRAFVDYMVEHLVPRIDEDIRDFLEQATDILEKERSHGGAESISQVQ